MIFYFAWTVYTDEIFRFRPRTSMVDTAPFSFRPQTSMVVHYTVQLSFADVDGRSLHRTASVRGRLLSFTTPFSFRSLTSMVVHYTVQLPSADVYGLSLHRSASVRGRLWSFTTPLVFCSDTWIKQRWVQLASNFILFCLLNKKPLEMLPIVFLGVICMEVLLCNNLRIQEQHGR